MALRRGLTTLSARLVLCGCTTTQQAVTETRNQDSGLSARDAGFPYRGTPRQDRLVITYDPASRILTPVDRRPRRCPPGAVLQDTTMAAHQTHPRGLELPVVTLAHRAPEWFNNGFDSVS